MIDGRIGGDRGERLGGSREQQAIDLVVPVRFGASGTFGKLVGLSSNPSLDPTARRSGVSGCAKAAFTVASSVVTCAWPSANKFWCVPQARSAAAWLEAATTES
jgi:hypothetical protein